MCVVLVSAVRKAALGGPVDMLKYPCVFVCLCICICMFCRTNLYLLSALVSGTRSQALGGQKTLQGFEVVCTGVLYNEPFTSKSC